MDDDMKNQDVQDEQPTNEPDEAPEQPEESPEDTEPTEEVEESTEDVDEESEDEAPQGPPQPSQAEIDAFPSWEQLPRDKDGNIDAKAFYDVMRQANQSAVRQAREIVNQTFQQQREEQRSWDKIFKKWPEVEKDKKSVNLIHTVRLGQLAKGESPDLYKIAKDLMGGRETAKSEGIKAANESTKVQKSASLEASSSTNKGASASQNELLEKTSSRNRLEADAARQELIRQMMDDGRL